MSPKKKFMTAESTFSAALGMGFVMQYGDVNFVPVPGHWGTLSLSMKGAAARQSG